MKARSPVYFVLIALLTLSFGAALAWQWRESVGLRTELLHARTAQDEWRRLQTEHARLRAQQISTAELERLRADHAALPRLRAELEALQKKR